MSAAVQIDRRYERLELRALDGELNSWGRWIERHADYTGFPSANMLETYIGGDGGGVPGHTILCLDMPVPVWATHHRVLRLHLDLQDAICACYVVRMKEDGTMWTLVEKCLKLGIAERTMRWRIAEAKRKILGLE
jgi:hypothetical protein